jgi:hypothetical protein
LDDRNNPFAIPAVVPSGMSPCAMRLATRGRDGIIQGLLLNRRVLKSGRDENGFHQY